MDAPEEHPATPFALIAFVALVVWALRRYVGDARPMT